MQDDYFDFNMATPIKVNNGTVYFSRAKNRFFQVRKIHDDYLIVGDFCKYYNDAKTNIWNAKVSWDFIKDCVAIDLLDTCEFIYHDNIGWRVKED